MRQVLLAATIALAACYAGGQQKSTPAGKVHSRAATASAAAEKAGPVTVYAPRKPVVQPRLIPLAKPPEFPKHCTRQEEGESEVSLLVDAEGRARNIMLFRPSGTDADLFAIVIAERDRFTPGTLNGKPVVVAESLVISMKACLAMEKGASGKLDPTWLLKSLPRQRLKKPRDPPQVAELAPLETPTAEVTRKVRRPDFFGNGKTAPVLLYSDYANYTPTHAGIKGTCKVSLVVDAHGLPQDVQVLKKLDPGLDQSALWAVDKYRFFPAIKNNMPVPAAVVVSVHFAPPEY